MRKFYKFSTSLLLTGALLMSSLPAVYADEDLLPEELFPSQQEADLPPGDPAMESTYNKYLLEHKYPQEIIDMLHIDQKRELYDDGGIYIGGSDITTTKMETPMNPDVNIPNQIRPLFLQDSNFTHVVTASRIRSAKRGLVDIKLNYNWDWNYAPKVTGKDTYAIGWTGGFIVRSDTAQQVYKVFGKQVHGSTYESKGNTYTRYDHINNGAGVGWDVNLVETIKGTDNRLYSVYRHKGWSGVKFQKGHDNSGNVEVNGVVGDYWHFYKSVKPEVTWTKNDGVTIKVDIKDDNERAKTTTDKFHFTNSDYIVQ